MKRIYQIALTLLPGIGDVKAKHLLKIFPNIEDLFRESKQGLKSVFGKNIAAIDAIQGKSLWERAEDELNFIEKNKIQVLFYTEPEYPVRLKRIDCSDSPVLLYFKGNTDLNTSKVISIVGTRQATEYGRVITEQLVKDFSDENILVVSGLAYGIDIHAHKMALQNNLPTVGVLAHGLDRIYPSVHKKTAIQMLEKGGILTDFMHGTNPDAGNFPSRNRIIAGLSDAAIVVEAGKKGGALITAEIANSYNRDVFAAPGDLNKLSSEGCNHLIKTNKAHLFQSAQDIYYILGWSKPKKREITQTNLFLSLTSDEKAIYDILLEKKTCNIDELIIQTDMSLSKIAGVLLNLELQNIIKCLPGKVYSIS